MNLSFNWPYALALIPLPLIFVWLRHEPSIDAGPFVPVEFAAIFDKSGVDGGWHTRLRQILLWLAWVFLVLAIAQPRLPLGVSIKAFSGRDIMLLVDLSGSMEKKDFEFDGASVTRLAVVKQVAGDFAVKRDGDRLGLVLFADEAFVASPLTFDVGSIRHYIGEAQIGLAGRSTALGDAIGLGLRRLNDSTSKTRVMVLLTDGSNNAGNVEPASAAQLAQQLNIPIHTIALGAESMTIVQFGEEKTVNPSLDLDVRALEQVAQQSGGRFYRASSTPQLQAIYSDIDKLETSEQTSPPFVPQKDVRIAPSLLALLCLVCAGVLYGRPRRWLA